MRGFFGVDIGLVFIVFCFYIWKFGFCEKLKKKK